MSLSVIAGSGPKSRSSGPQGQASSHSGHGPRDGGYQTGCSGDSFFPFLHQPQMHQTLCKSPEDGRGSPSLTQIPRTESQRAEEQPVEKQTQECERGQKNLFLKLSPMGEEASAAESSIHMALCPLAEVGAGSAGPAGTNHVLY